MEHLLETGYASPYFVTDPQRSIAEMTAPAVFLALDEFNLDTFAACLAALKKLSEQRALKGLLDVIGNGKTGEAILFDQPLLVLARRINDNALAPLLILKMRGYFQTLALACEPHTPTERIDIGAALGAGTRVSETLWLWAEARPLNVVSGAKASALSTERSCEELLKQYPALCQS